MRELSVSEAFDLNDRAYDELKALVGSLTNDQLAMRDVSQDNWSVAEIVEHISIVEGGIAILCGRLLQKAKDEGRSSDGKIKLSNEFLVGAERIISGKLQAPERVRPTGAKTIEDSFAAMAATSAKLDELRPLFEEASSSDATFPHPYLGDLTAAEWLCLVGGHSTRHMRQIRRILNSQTGEAL